MLFNSVHFLVFSPAVAIVYFLLPLRTRRVFLLAASFYFYGVWSIKWSLLLLYTIVQDYAAARIIGGSDRSAVRRAALITSLTGNLLVLGIFKYFNFFSESLAALSGTPLWPTLQSRSRTSYGGGLNGTTRYENQTQLQYLTATAATQLRSVSLYGALKIAVGRRRDR